MEVNSSTLDPTTATVPFGIPSGSRPSSIAPKSASRTVLTRPSSSPWQATLRPA